MTKQNFQTMGFKVGDVVMCTSNDTIASYKVNEPYTLKFEEGIGLVTDNYFNWSGSGGTWELFKKGGESKVEDKMISVETQNVYSIGTNFKSTSKFTVVEAYLNRCYQDTTYGDVGHFIVVNRKVIQQLLKELDEES